jgi:hypothetical protein
MDKKDCLQIIMVLAALESWSYSHNSKLPDWLQEDMSNTIDKLKAKILEDRDEKN